MKLFMRLLLAFLAVTGGVAIAMGGFGIRFGHENFWSYHGALFLVLVVIFPRLTLLLATAPTGGLLYWLSWLFAPRLLVAVLATITYWFQNPLLVVISWLVALGGESSEKYVVMERSRSRKKGFESARWVDSRDR